MSSTERKLRQALKNAGFVLHKSRARNRSLCNQLGYMIVDIYINKSVGGSSYNYSLEDVEQFVEMYCNN